MAWVRITVLCCAVIATLMTSRASAGGRNKNFFHGYGGPPQHFVKHAYTRHYYGLGHAVSNYPPFWLYDNGKKGGGKRRGRGGKKRDRGGVIVVKHGGYGGYGGGHGGGYGGGYDDYDYYDDLY
ncbi:glycine-rich cell wall structural protein-like [Amphibalanus amphitrite]|uniref:glycine-rich cell wall structural protein-like n=1 Tax=Amphibalanus amphitrite TaxID=1232801 RepID=UPI001C91ED16|nr:glycine-rich cell wall structural protein-like [Amphibalanus amphitrite]